MWVKADTDSADLAAEPLELRCRMARSAAGKSHPSRAARTFSHSRGAAWSFSSSGRFAATPVSAKAPGPDAARPGGARRFRVPASLSMPKRIFEICHYCGYSPTGGEGLLVCPKCHGSSWERFALPVAALPDHMKS